MYMYYDNNTHLSDDAAPSSMVQGYEVLNWRMIRVATWLQHVAEVGA